jgi:membrane associated rhomboid family serine protease
MRDLPPRRRSSPAPAWTRPVTERLTPAITALVVAMAAVGAFYGTIKVSQPFFVAHLALGPGLLHGEIWQPVTALFVHFDFLGFVFNVIGLWYVGAFIERTNGTRRFLQLFFTAGILGFVAMGLVGHVTRAFVIGGGCSYAVLALFVAFGKMYNRTPVQILGALHLQARYLAAGLVAWAVIAELTQANWGGLTASLVATAVGFGSAGGGFGDLLALFRGRRLRRRYQVLDGGQSKAGSKTGTKKGRTWN